MKLLKFEKAMDLGCRNYCDEKPQAHYELEHLSNMKTIQDKTNN